MKKKILLLLPLISNIAFAQYLPNGNLNTNKVPQNIASAKSASSVPVVSTTLSSKPPDKYILPEKCKEQKPCDTCQPARLIFEQFCELNKFSEVNEVIAWWGKKPSSTGKGTMLNDWTNKGIKNPFTNEDLIRQSKSFIEENNKQIEAMLKEGKKVDPKVYKPWIYDHLMELNTAIKAEINKKIEAERKDYKPINPLAFVLEKKDGKMVVKPPPGFDINKFTQPPTVTQPQIIPKPAL